MDFNNQTLQLGPDEIRPITVGNTTPAIQALMDATRSGALDYDAINKHFNEGVNTVGNIEKTKTEVQTERNTRELAPKIQAAKKAALDLQEALRPLNESTAAANAGTANIAAKGAQTLAPGAVALAGEGQNQAEALTADAKEARAADPDNKFGLVKAVQDWEKTVGGPLPVSDNGVGTDYTKLLGGVHQIQSMRLQMAGQNPAVVQAMEGLTKEALSKGVEIIDPKTGRLKPYAQLQSEVTAAPPLMGLADIQKSKAGLNSASAGMKVLERAQKFVNDPKTEPVGPAVTQGGAPTVTAIRAMVPGDLAGGAEKKLQQDYLRITLAQTVQDTIRSMAGTGNKVMRAEIDNEPKADGSGGGLFYQAMPPLNADKKIWNDWINARRDLIARAHEDTRSLLPASERGNYGALISSAPVGPTVATPAVPSVTAPGRPPGVNNQGFIPPDAPEFQIQSKVAVPWPGMSKFNSLQPGQPYFDNRGNLRIKG